MPRKWQIISSAVLILLHLIKTQADLYAAGVQYKYTFKNAAGILPSRVRQARQARAREARSITPFWTPHAIADAADAVARISALQAAAMDATSEALQVLILHALLPPPHPTPPHPPHLRAPPMMQPAHHHSSQH